MYKRVKVFYWSEGPRKTHDNAQVVGDFLESLSKGNNGRLKARDVVDAARSRKSPIHDEFEWNDTKAAESYRLSQAGDLLRHIKVHYITEDNQKIDLGRSWVNIETDDDQGRSYLPKLKVLNDDILRARMVDDALVQAGLWKKRYKELNELSRIFESIDSTTVEVIVRRKKHGKKNKRG